MYDPKTYRVKSRTTVNGLLNQPRAPNNRPEAVPPTGTTLPQKKQKGTKKPHLIKSERKTIESGLNDGKSFSEIARIVGKHRSTIDREVKKYSVTSQKTESWTVHNACINRRKCTLSMMCQDENCSKPKCRDCKMCNLVCPEFVEETCPHLEKPPYVCNGCKIPRCSLNRMYYSYRQADDMYRKVLTESRSGVTLTEEELLELDQKITPWLQNGQSIHVFYTHNINEMPVCERSLYNYVDGSLFEARNIDMPRKMRLKPRRHVLQHKIDKQCRIGRSLDDFEAFMATERDKCMNNTPVVEMDTVVGCAGSSKCLLTFQVVSADFMFMFLRDRNTAQSVIDKINWIQEQIGLESFRRIFSVIKTDNGTEFSNVKAIEMDADGEQRARVFYCNPYCSFEKPHVELNHEFIRRVLPKGASFDHLTQVDINKLMSHVNSYIRKNLADKSPYEVFGFLYGRDILDKLGISYVEPQDVCLKRRLLPRPPQGVQEEKTEDAEED